MVHRLARRLSLVSIGLGGVVFGAYATGGCGSDESIFLSGDASPPEDEAGIPPAFGNNPDATSDAGGTCNTHADCDGGYCADGVCCANAESACGKSCCTGGTACVFDKCVTPGKVCHSSNDCAGGEYCETALGSGASDAGVPEAGPDGSVCTAALPLSGRCVPRPPTCGDGGVGPAGCIAACEYHPPVGPLTAEEKWRWGYNLGPSEFPNHVDVWATPTVGRVYDGNCDGKVDEFDSPNIIFVSGDSRTAAGVGTCCQCTGATPSACHTGVLRMIDGRTGATIWSLDKAPLNAAGHGFAGLSPALADIDGDGRLDIIVATGDGYIVMVDAAGVVKRRSDFPVEVNPANGANTVIGVSAFGWGGGLSVADMDHDGFPEIAYGRTVFTTKNGAITRVFQGTAGRGGANIQTPLSTFADLFPGGGAGGANALELVAGNTAYLANGTVLWDRAVTAPTLPDGFSAVADFNKDGLPEVVLVASGSLYILNGATGATLAGPLLLPGTGFGGPPTVADFDGDGFPEVGVAKADFYSVAKPNLTTGVIDVLWSHPNHDFSSSETGSTVFDFEGDGKAEVVYADECYLWVWGYDNVQKKAVVRFATPSTSFTATEASIVADIDGDGHAELLMVSNRADPSATGTWKCDIAPWNDPSPDAGRPPGTPQWKPPTGQPAYRGLTAFGDRANAWVGTRTLWNQHAYHVSNVCDNRDSACSAPNAYGAVPTTEQKNWSLPWLNNFRQNVQDQGIFDAPDAVVSMKVNCDVPTTGNVSVRNIGKKSLPAGVDVGVYLVNGAARTLVATLKTTNALFPGQTAILPFTASQGTGSNMYIAKILLDPAAPKFHQCREDNDESAPATGGCSLPK